MEAHQLDVYSQWLRIQIHKQTTRGRNTKNNVAVVRNENGLGRNKLRRYYPQVELWQRAMGITLSPRIYWENPGAISPSPTKKTTRLSTSSSANKIHTNNTSVAIPRRIPRLDENGINIIQKICGSILWYMRACDITTTKALNAIGSDQSKAT